MNAPETDSDSLPSAGTKLARGADARRSRRYGSWRPEIVRFVRHREGVTVHEIAARFRINPHMARGRADTMVEEGTLERSKGVYRVKDAGPC